MFISSVVSGSKQLYKKAGEVELSQPKPSFSRGLDPPPRKVSTPPKGCFVYRTASTSKARYSCTGKRLADVLKAERRRHISMELPEFWFAVDGADVDVDASSDARHASD